MVTALNCVLWVCLPDISPLGNNSGQVFHTTAPTYESSTQKKYSNISYK